MASQIKILVLDDNVDVAQGVGEILDISGYAYDLVHDGKSAIQSYLTGNYSLGLFDVRMPGINGVEAFLEIRRAMPQASILMMTGYADDKLVTSALDNGALGVLSKPFDPDEMLNKIEETVSGLTVAA